MTRNAPRLAALAGAAAVALVAVAGVQGGGSATPSYAKDVAPILRDKCAGCHQTGGIAPFSLETAAQARKMAPAIGAAVGARIMPPWLPGPKSPRYVGQELRTLTAAQRSTLVAWAKAGGRVDGRGLGRPAPPDSLVRPGEREVELQPAAPYLPVAARGATDDYRCFLLDPGVSEDAYVTSTRIEPGQNALVHHVIVYRVTPDRLPFAERLDAAAAGEGWPCFGGTHIPAASVDETLNNAGWVGAWVPGVRPERAPDGVGVPLPAGSRIVMQVHYNLLNGRKADRSTVALTLAPGRLALQALRTMPLPAPVELACGKSERGPLCARQAALADLRAKYGDVAQLADGLHVICGGDPTRIRPAATSTCDRVFARPATIRAVGAHMHLLGATFRVDLNPGTPRARVLLDIPRWDFHWQGSYRLAAPVAVRAGDVVRVTCRFDVGLRGAHGTPKTPRYIMWGEGTTDEMCLGALLVTD